MLWLGLFIGFCAGVMSLSFAYWRLTERFDESEARLRGQRELTSEAIREVGRLSAENNTLRRLSKKPPSLIQ